MFGLFKISFDYYAWEDLVCVSAVKESLEKFYKENIGDYPLYNKEKSDEIKEGRSEEYHYVILEVKEI